jgi:hypothetical protein
MEFEIARTANAVVRIFDELGRVVLEHNAGQLEAGNYKFTLPSHGINSGIYSIVVSSGEQVLTGRVVVAN